MNMDRVDEIIQCYGSAQANSLTILQDIQREYHYLPREALELTAERLSVSLGEIYRLATFFTSFSLEPKGRFVCRVCLGTACHVLGGPRILDSLERKLGIKAGQTTEDKVFTLEAVRCLGACALGPVVVVNEEPHAYMTAEKTNRLIDRLIKEAAQEPAEIVALADV